MAVIRVGDRVQLTDHYINMHEKRDDRIKLLSLIGTVVKSGQSYSTVQWDTASSLSYSVFTHIIQLIED